MAHPRLFVKNFFNALAYTENVVSANEEPAANPASRVGRGSRNPSNFWTPTTANAAAWIQVRNLDGGSGTDRFANMIVIDRVHNLGGETITLYKSNTGAFGGEEVSVFAATIPTVADTDADLAAANGVLTAEGAWLKSFAATSEEYWRLSIPAMGAGLKPEIGGLYLGSSWSFAQHEDLPFQDETYEATWPERTLASLWIGAGEPRSRRILEMTLRLQSAAEYLEYRDQILDHYRKRRPMWVLHDPTNNAERAALFVLPSGQRVGFSETRDWHLRGGQIIGIEHEPLRTL